MVSVTQRDVEDYVNQLKASGAAQQTPRRIKLLEHLLDAELRGEGATIKAYSLGVDFFGKPDDFDASTDSSVRVEMGRLRTMIALFEASEAATTRIVVDIPVGSYRPKIALRQSAEPLEDVGETPDRYSLVFKLSAVAAAVVALVVFLGTTFGDRESTSRIAVQLVTDGRNSPSEEIALEAFSAALSRSTTIKLFEASDGWWGSEGNSRFRIILKAYGDTDARRLSTKLISIDDGQIIWAREVRINSNEAIVRRVYEELAPELRVRLFGAAKQILQAQPPEDLTPEELFVMATWVPGVHESHLDAERRSIELSRMAVEKDPSFGAAHSVIADKLAFLANIHAPDDTPENRQASEYHSQRAMDLSPLDPDVVFNVALAKWHNGNVSESIELTKRVIEIDPGHDLARFLTLVHPHSCSVAPDEAVDQAIRFDERLAEDNPIRWVTLNWIGWLHAYRGDMQAALAAEEAGGSDFPNTIHLHAPRHGAE